MRIDEVINEDSWWEDKLKRGVQNLGKISPWRNEAKGALSVRRRAAELMSSYKTARGKGLDSTGNALIKWLRSGEVEPDEELIKQALDKTGFSKSEHFENESLTYSQIRDFLVAYAGAEQLSMGDDASNPRFNKQKKSSNRSYKEQHKSKDIEDIVTFMSNNPDSINLIKSVLKQVSGN